MRIKKTIQETVNKEVDVETPYYSKKGYDYYMTLSDNEAVNVYLNFDKTFAGIDLIKGSCNKVDKALEADPITEQEFNQAFESALDVIKKDVTLWVSVTPLPTEELTIENL